MPSNDEPSPDNLARGDRAIEWDWHKEDPVEVVLVAFILILFFTLPRQGCRLGVQGDAGIRPAFTVDQPAAERVDE
ncbi:MAG: hypothetical protein ABEL76_15025 [Bradymonadaceae bacterium]